MADLYGVKVGDRLIIVDDDIYESVVIRVTPEQVVANNRKFWRKNGDKVGQDIWHMGHAYVPTLELEQQLAEARAERQHRKMIGIFRGYNWHNLTLDEMTQVVDLLEAIEKQKREGAIT